MKYIAKAKSANRFKTYDSITEFEVSDFDGYDLYEVKKLDKQQYGNVLKQQKIEELKKQLQELGVNLNAPTLPTQPQNQPQILNEVPHEGSTTESPLLMADNVNSGVKLSKVQKPDGSLFSMDEITTSFYKVKDELEKQIPEISYGSFDENGIVFTVTEPTRIPSKLPNGIPVRQIVG